MFDPYIEPQCEKTYIQTCAPNKDSNQPVHLCRLVRLFVVHMKKLCIFAIQNVPSEDSDYADLNLCWVHMSGNVILLISDIYHALWSTSLWADSNQKVQATVHTCRLVGSRYKPLVYFVKQREKTNLLTCAPTEDSDQTAHLRKLLIVFVVCMKKLCILGYSNCAQWRF